MGIDISMLSPRAQQQVLEKLKTEQVKNRTAAKETYAQKDNQRVSKYNAEKVMRGALRFDSKKEARRFDELMLLLEGGMIFDLRLQPQFTLQESYMTPKGVRIRAIRYVADFSYRKTLPDGREEFVVEGTKSNPTKTPQYKIKRKLLQERFGITITEV